MRVMFFRLVFNLLFLCSASLFGMERAEVERPGRYEEPKTRDEAQEQVKKAEEARERSQEELKERQERWDVAIKKAREAKTVREQKSAARVIDQEMQDWFKVQEVKKEWDARVEQLAQNKLVQQLGLLREKVETFDSAQQQIQKRILSIGDKFRIWKLKAKIFFYERIIGDKVRVEQFRNDLANFYVTLDNTSACWRKKNRPHWCLL